jgi:hypothetical protein
MSNNKNVNEMKKMNNYEAPMAEMIELHVQAAILNYSNASGSTPSGGGGGMPEDD